MENKHFEKVTDKMWKTEASWKKLLIKSGKLKGFEKLLIKSGKLKRLEKFTDKMWKTEASWKIYW